MHPAAVRSKVAPAPPLSRAERARARRLAIVSHPAGNSFNVIFSQYLPTLALVALGASETVVGLQSGLASSSHLLQLPTLRAVGRHTKKTILIAGHVAALIAASPLLFYGALAAQGGSFAVGVVFTSLVLTSAAINVSNAVWFPLLRGYVEIDRIGHFFGMIRSGWHLALILFFVGSTLWLSEREGDFAPLFAVAFGLGVLRIFLIARLPERDERTGARVRVREALGLIRGQPLLRRYLAGVALSAAMRSAVLPFVIVMMRREIGFSSAEVIYTTIALFTGGLVSLLAWGRVVDRAGPEPVFRWSSLGMAALYLSLLWVQAPGGGLLAGMVVFFFAHAVLASGHGVADTRVLFELAPPEAPARTLVIASVAVHSIAGLAPILGGLLLDGLLASAPAPLAVYHGFFAVAGLLQALSFLPLRAFRR